MPWNRLILEDDAREIEVTIDVKVDPLGIIDRSLNYHGNVRYRAKRGHDKLFPMRVLTTGEVEWHPDLEDSSFKIHGEMLHPNSVFHFHDPDEEKPDGYTYELTIRNFGRHEL